MRSNVVENNYSLTDYYQSWSSYVFTDAIPENTPDLKSAINVTEKYNNDGTSYTIRAFEKTEHENTYIYLLYVSNFQLTKEFRQGKSWKFLFGDSEASIRNIILPKAAATISEAYAPKFSNGEFELSYTSVDPKFDLNDCRIDTGLDFDKLYFTGWLYAGKNLQELLSKGLPPFDDKLWLLKNEITGNKASFKVNQETRYELPADTFKGTEDSHTLISTNILNQVIDKFGIVDEGVFW